MTIPAAEDFDFIGKRLAQLEDEQNRIALGCTCNRQYDSFGNITWSINGSCPMHGADIAMGYTSAMAMQREAYRAALLAKLGYRVGAGPDPVTGKCHG